MSDREPKRILILTADHGFGHRAAANAVSAALQEKYGAESQVTIDNPIDNPRTPSFLRKSQVDYNEMVRKMPQQYKLGYTISNEPVPNFVIERGLTLLLYSGVRDAIQRTSPEAVVVTNSLYHAPLGALSALNSSSFAILTTITDLSHVHRQWFYEGVDMLCLPTEETFQQAISYGFLKEHLRITGIPVSPRLSAFTEPRAVLRQQLGWQPVLTTIVVVGSARVKNLENALKGINHSSLPIQLVLIAGGDPVLYENFQQTDWHLPVHIYNFVQDMPHFMNAADAIISKAGGLIVSEAMACHLPFLFIDITPGQEEGNARYVIEHGAGDLATDPLSALEILHHWLANDHALLKERSLQAQHIGHPHAACEVADLTWQAAAIGHTRAPIFSTQALHHLRELISNAGISPELTLPGLSRHKSSGESPSDPHHVD